MKRGTPEHPKTLALAERLKIDRLTAVGLLECLWHFAAAYAPRGDVGKFTNKSIARGVYWTRDPDDLIAGLVDCRWLDEHPEHRLVVHDWKEHTERYVRLRVERHNETLIESPRGRTTPRKPRKKRATCAHNLGAQDERTDRAHLPAPAPAPLPVSAAGAAAGEAANAAGSDSSSSQRAQQGERTEPDPAVSAALLNAGVFKSPAARLAADPNITVEMVREEDVRRRQKGLTPGALVVALEARARTGSNGAAKPARIPKSPHERYAEVYNFADPAARAAICRAVRVTEGHHNDAVRALVSLNPLGAEELRGGPVKVLDRLLARLDSAAPTGAGGQP